MTTSAVRAPFPSATQATLHVEDTRPRTAPRPPRSAFSATLRAGLEVGASVLAGPIVGAAIRSAGRGAAPVGTGSDSSTFDQVRALQEQSQTFNLEYLALQEQVQEENRRFSTVSNVLKAKHETAKSAIGNIRS